jgi:hypothetical protein
MIDLFAGLGSVLAVVGVVANNHRLRWCFLVWMVSNSIAFIIHGILGPLPYAGRDFVFLYLAVHGWITWGKRRGGLTNYDILKGSNYADAY